MLDVSSSRVRVKIESRHGFLDCGQVFAGVDVQSAKDGLDGRGEGLVTDALPLLGRVDHDNTVKAGLTANPGKVIVAGERACQIEGDRWPQSAWCLPVVSPQPHECHTGRLASRIPVILRLQSAGPCLR